MLFASFCFAQIQKHQVQLTDLKEGAIESSQNLINFLIFLSTFF